MHLPNVRVAFAATVLLLLVGLLLTMRLPAGFFSQLCLSGIAMHYMGLPPNASTAAIVKLALSHLRSALCTETNGRLKKAVVAWLSTFPSVAIPPAPIRYSGASR